MSGLAGRRPGRVRKAAIARQARSWLAWWVVLMVLWIVADDSIGRDELLAGAGAAALAALLATVVIRQAAVGWCVRVRWLAAAMRLPGQVARDTVTVFAALAKRAVRGEEPRSGFVALPVGPGPETAEGRMRTALLVGAHSLAPNTVVLDIDRERGALLAHKLVLGQGDEHE